MQSVGHDSAPAEILTPGGGLLNTIKVPRNLTILTYCLPEANYENGDPNKLARHKSEIPLQPMSCRGLDDRGAKGTPRDLQVIHEHYYNHPKSSHSRSESRPRDISNGRRNPMPSYSPIG